MLGFVLYPPNQPMIPTPAGRRCGHYACESVDADRHVDLQLWERNKGSFRTKAGGPLTLASQATALDASVHATTWPQQMQAREHARQRRGRPRQARPSQLLGLSGFLSPGACTCTHVIPISSVRHAWVVLSYSLRATIYKL